MFSTHKPYIQFPERQRENIFPSIFIEEETKPLVAGACNFSPPEAGRDKEISGLHSEFQSNERQTEVKR